MKLAVVTIISMVATAGVYGMVGLIVRMDDLGYKLVKASKGRKNSLHFIGMGLVNALPLVIKSLSVVGTVALLLVSGGIFVHNVSFFHHFLEGNSEHAKRFNNRGFCWNTNGICCEVI